MSDDPLNHRLLYRLSSRDSGDGLGCPAVLVTQVFESVGVVTMDKKGYPDNWPEVAKAVKDAAGWRCVRCGHPHERPGQPIACDEKCDPARHAGGLNDGKQRILTVHHLLEKQKDNLAWWNLVPLCQVCHLQIQGKVKMERRWIFEHSSWFKPYVAGWYAYIYLGQQLSREEVENRLDELLALERVI